MRCVLIWRRDVLVYRVPAYKYVCTTTMDIYNINCQRCLNIVFLFILTRPRWVPLSQMLQSVCTIFTWKFALQTSILHIWYNVANQKRLLKIYSRGCQPQPVCFTFQLFGSLRLNGLKSRGWWVCRRFDKTNDNFLLTCYRLQFYNGKWPIQHSKMV
jgi:hypothetical protein